MARRKTAAEAEAATPMRKTCPNYDNAGALDTVLEVPIPEEMFTNMGSNTLLRWQNLSDLMKSRGGAGQKQHLSAGSDAEFLSLLKLVGSPLIPFQVQLDHTRVFTRPNFKVGSLETSEAKYIVQQYIAATGGEEALNSVSSMVVMGQVKMVAMEMQKDKSELPEGNGEMGGFVLWTKNPDLWYLELVVSGYKVSAGSNGKIAWNQSSTQPCHPNKSSPRPLRRIFQGLDPKSIAHLFSEAACIGEENVNGYPCFILKIETDVSILKAQSRENTEIVHHTIWGFFCQRTGLLVQFSDTKLVKMNSPYGDDIVYWETSMESSIGDYRHVDSINIGHSGKTSVVLYRYGETHSHKRRIEETWRIEEIDFNICGLTMDSFLPPAELTTDQDGIQL